MDSKHDLESYIMRCARKYEERHPDKKVNVRCEEKSCTFCTTKTKQKPILDKDQIKVCINDDALIVQGNFGTETIKLYCCPMCGRVFR